MSITRSGCILAVVLFAAGCSKPPAPAPRARLRPEVKVVDVAKRNIVRIAGQPGFIEAYEQTAIFAKVSGYVDQWNVDIGDALVEGQVLAHLFVPDLVAEYEEKKAEVKLADVRVQVAREMVKVAEENWKNAGAQVEEARANLGKYAADVARWEADYKRIKKLFDQNAVEEPKLDESLKHWKTTVAADLAGKASVVVAEANQSARQVDIAKAKVDVDAALARTKVARETEKRYAALVGYTSIHAPYGGIVVRRNVNQGDLVQPGSGDPSGTKDGSGSRAAPLYVVARTDKVRIFLDVPEMEASGVRVGNRAWVTIEAVDGPEIKAKVTRTSWALSTKSRTLRAEIDIPNPRAPMRPLAAATLVGLAGAAENGPLFAASTFLAERSEGLILPNMYAYGKVEIKRSGVWAVPMEAIVELGNQPSCYEYQGGKAMLLPIQRGIDDGTWVEVSRKRVKGEWVPFDGSEKVITGDLTQLSAGEEVRESSPK